MSRSPKPAHLPQAPSGQTGFHHHAASSSSLGTHRARFRVERADPRVHGRAVHLLVDRMYSWRGLIPQGSSVATSRPDTITIVASSEEEVFGTVSLGLDLDNGLLADALYAEELAQLRRRGARLGEVTKLAVHNADNTRRVLGELFHLMYVHGRLIHGLTEVVAEVHPRHAMFYRRMLGFTPLGGERICPRVNAPAVLLHLDLEHVTRQIALHGGSALEQAGETERTLYAHFFSPREQDELHRRLLERH